jgi:hypothetical protein
MAYAFNVLGYIKYYQRHTYYVVLAWKDIQNILIENGIINEDEFNRINHLILCHDNSKIDEEEFEAYGTKFYPLKSDVPIVQEDIDTAFKAAWAHHKANNIHHHQTLKDYQGSDWKCFLIEMLCDWIAMGWETGTLASDYYQMHKEKIDLPIEYKVLLEELLNLINKSECYANGQFSNEKEAELAFK